MKSTKLTLAIMLMASIGAQAQVHRFVGPKADIMHQAMPNMSEIMTGPINRVQIYQPQIQPLRVVPPVVQAPSVTVNNHRISDVIRTPERISTIQSFHGSLYINMGVAESGVLSKVYGGRSIIDPAIINIADNQSQ